MKVLTSGEMRTRMRCGSPPTVVSVSGIDGSGKTVLISSLVANFRAKGISVNSARFDLPDVLPGHSLPDYVFSLFADKDEAVDEGLIGDCIAFEYMRFHMTSIFLHSRDTELLILDRFLWDYLLTNEIAFDSLTGTQVALLHALPQPEVRLFVDCDPDIASARIANREESATVLERRDILAAKRKRYRALADELGGTLLDGTKAQGEVLASAVATVESFLISRESRA